MAGTFVDWRRGRPPCSQVSSCEYPLGPMRRGAFTRRADVRAGSAAPLPPWWDDLERERPRPHVTQGKACTTDYGQAIDPEVACARRGRCSRRGHHRRSPLDTLRRSGQRPRRDLHAYDELLPRMPVTDPRRVWRRPVRVRYGSCRSCHGTARKEEKPRSRRCVGVVLASGGGSGANDPRQMPCAADISRCSQPHLPPSQQRSSSDEFPQPPVSRPGRIGDRLPPPRRDLAPENTVTPRRLARGTIMGSANYIGRVGGLALALGVGFAVATEALVWRRLI